MGQRSLRREDWAAVVAQLRPFVRSRVRSPVDAEDVLQEILLRVHCGRDRLRDERCLGAWLHRIASRAVADYGRRQRATSSWTEEVERSDEGAFVRAPEAHEDELNRRLLTASVAHFIKELPAPYRQALTLVEIEGLNQRQAAERLGISVSGVKSRVQRGRLKVRARVEECCELEVDARHRVVGCRCRQV